MFFLKLSRPHCPSCGAAITLVQSFAMWNPWRVQCPACKADLQMSLVAKVGGLLAVPLGIGIAAVPIYMEETKRWVTADSLTYFGIIAPCVLLAGLLAWSRTELLPRRGK